MRICRKIRCRYRQLQCAVGTDQGTGITDGRQRGAAETDRKLCQDAGGLCGVPESRVQQKFRAAHETEILLHQAAKKHFDEVGITKLPSVKSLREEYAGLLEQKRKAYSSYKQARADMKELYNIRANVEHLLDIPTGREPQKESQKSRQ